MNERNALVLMHEKPFGDETLCECALMSEKI